MSEDARLAIDEYVFDPATNEGSTDFSVLKGVFVFTSGLIGREDPDDVTIETPVGSIGIRGTIIAGNVDDGEITVVEGAIVLRDFQGNEVTLANQFETARFDAEGGGIQHMGELSADEMGAKFGSVAGVAGDLFSSIKDAANDKQGDAEAEAEAENGEEAELEAEAENGEEAELEAETEPEAENGEEAQSEEKTEAEAEPEADLKTEAEPESQTDTQSALESKNDAIQQKLSQNSGLNTQNTIDLEASRETIKALGETGDTSTSGSEDTNDTAKDTSVSTTDTTYTPSTQPEDTNLAPHHVAARAAPDEYFASVEGKTWTYNFGREFRDPDGAREDLTFHLTQDTKTKLASVSDSSYTWDVNTGALEISLKSVLAEDETFGIKIGVTDGEGGGTTKTYSFTAYDLDGDLTNTTQSNDDQVLKADSTNYSNVVGDNNTVFLSNLKDFITVEGTGNTIYMGDSDGTFSTITIKDSADGTTALGGKDVDKFTIENADVEIYGLNGDDVIKLDINKVTTSNINALSNDGDDNTNTVIDGGRHDGLSWAQQWAKGKAAPDFSNKGDALWLTNTGSPTDFDFSLIDDLQDKITGIEVLDMESPTGIVHAKLNYQDIIDITDGNNTLVVKLGANDTLTVNNASGLNSSGTERINSIDYDIWTDGTVTLLIDDGASSSVTIQ